MNVLSDGTAITLSQSRPPYTVCVHRTLARRGDTFLSHDRPTEWRCRAHDRRERPTTCRPRSPDLAPRGRSSTAGSAKSTASASRKASHRRSRCRTTGVASPRSDCAAPAHLARFTSRYTT